MHRDGDSLVLCLQGSMLSVRSLLGVCLNAQDCRMHGNKPMAKCLLVLLVQDAQTPEGWQLQCLHSSPEGLQAHGCSALVMQVSPSSPNQMQDSKALAAGLHRQHLSAQSCKHKHVTQHARLPDATPQTQCLTDAAGLERGMCPAQPQA